MIRILAIIAVLFGILGLLVACENPTDTSKAVPLGLTVKWGPPIGAKTLVPASYPALATYDVVLTASGQTTLSQTAIPAVTTSWTFSRIAQVPWTVTVTGYDAGHNVIVGGTSSVDLTNGTASTTVVLSYIYSGSGTGSLLLTLDETALVAAGFSVTATSLALTDPTGATNTYAGTDGGPVGSAGQFGSFTGNLAVLSLTSAKVGNWSAVYTITASGQTAIKVQSILIVQYVQTAGTIVVAAGDFLNAVTGVTLSITNLSGVTVTNKSDGTANEFSLPLQLENNGGSETLTATVLGTGSQAPTNQTVTWTSDNTAVAMVSSSGTVTPVVPGSTFVRVTSNDGAYQANCAVTVHNVTLSALAGGAATNPIIGGYPDGSGSQAGFTEQFVMTMNPATGQLLVLDSNRGNSVRVADQTANSYNAGTNSNSGTVVTTLISASIGTAAFGGVPWTFNDNQAWNNWFSNYSAPVPIVMDLSGNIYFYNNGIASSPFTLGQYTLSGSGSVATATYSTLASSSNFYYGSHVPWMVIDANNLLYFPDPNGGTTILRVNSHSASLTNPNPVIAGGGTATVSGVVDGTGTAATFGSIKDVAVDSTSNPQNLFVYDAGFETFRRLNLATGVVTTIAGASGYGGYANGSGIAVRFNWYNNPATISRGMVKDSADNYYFMDDNGLRKVAATGEVSTVLVYTSSPGTRPGSTAVGSTAVNASAGTYPSAQATLNNINSLVFDPATNCIYCIDGWSQCIWRIGL
jgi:hypothetical protein